MTFNYFKSEQAPHLIDSFYESSYDSNDIPFESRILPTGQSHFIYVDSENPYELVISKRKFYNKGLIISGQSYRSYHLQIDAVSSNSGICFHPTTIYKLLKEDLSNYTDKHIDLSKVSLILFEKLNPVFESNLEGEEKAKALEKIILDYPLYEDKNTKQIDKAINFIRENNGLMTVDCIVKRLKISQKNLEIQFKKIVGLTPGKYIKLFRFLCLMKKYESQEIDLKELITMYNYYDHSHFSKDFKLFMNEAPKSYFKKDNLLLKNYLKE